MAKITVCLILSVLFSIGHALTSIQAASIRANLRNLLINDQNLIGGFLRLSFHDCVGVRCDGCVNLAQSDNAGLQTYVNTLETFRATFNLAGVITRADLWALAGSEAVLFAASGGPPQAQCSASLVFKWGRTDCSTAPNTTTVFTFPSANGNNAATVGFFATEFGFSDRETVAIMGAHSVGEAHPTASGFRGPWDQTKNRFNNAYYQDLQNGGLGWRQVNVAPPRGDPRYQWNNNRVPSQMMLDADMSLVKNFPVTSTGQVTTCSYPTCTSPSTAAYVAAFAANNCQWISEFYAVYTKMISKGYTTLQNVV